MSEAPNRYPLAWPAHKPRTKAADRQRGTSGETVAGKSRRVSIATACDRLEGEIERLGGVYPVLSTNIELRMDGRPRADRAAPADPGVCVYFSIKGVPYAMACDTYDEVAQNIAAIGNHIDATRRITRYGVATAAETLQAFRALPGPSTPGNPPTGPGGHGERPWHEVLSVSPDATAGVINAAYRELAKHANEHELLELNLARDFWLRPRP